MSGGTEATLALPSETRRTIAQLARDRVATEPERVMLVDGGVEFNARVLWEGACRLSSWMRRNGISPGDVISFQLPNWHEASIVNLAASILGAVVHPIVPIFREAEVEFMLRDCGSRLVFAPATYRGFEHIAMMQHVAERMNQPPLVVSVRGKVPGVASLAEIIATGQGSVDVADVPAEGVKLVLYTSGTTGRPKAVLHSHQAIHLENLKTLEAAGLSEVDVMFNPSPVTHITGALYGLNLPWFAGVKIVLMDMWNADQAFDTMSRYECTYMAGATPFLQDLIRVATERSETLPKLRRFTCGGAGVPPSLIREARGAFPNCHTWRAFGATECPTITVMPDDLEHAAETDGRIWRAEVKVVDPVSGEAVPHGAEGEILARAPNMALGYLHKEDNATGYDPEGFFRTGDLGRIVDEQYILITGRKKDLIIRAGENISAKEIEDVLIRDARIADVAVVGLPTPRIGEAICAVVVAVPGASVDLALLISLVQAAGLAKQKSPEHLVLREELPRTAAGKVRKDLLRQSLLS